MKSKIILFFFILLFSFFVGSSPLGAVTTTNPLEGFGGVTRVPIVTTTTSDDTRWTVTTGEGVSRQNPDGTSQGYTRTTDSEGRTIYTSVTNPSDRIVCSEANRCVDGGGNVDGPMSDAFSQGQLQGQGGGGASSPATVFTTELVPGANCQCAEGADCTKVETRKYKCTLEGSGISGFQKIFATVVNYAVNITMLLCVLALVGLGIAWSMAGGDDVKMKSTLKKWGINIIIGFLILLFFRYILMFLAPWIFQ